MMRTLTTASLAFLFFTATAGCFSTPEPSAPVNVTQQSLPAEVFSQTHIVIDGQTGRVVCVDGLVTLVCPVSERGSNDNPELKCEKGTPVGFVGNLTWDSPAKATSPEFQVTFGHYNESAGHWQTTHAAYDSTRSPFEFNLDFTAFKGERIAVLIQDWYTDTDPAAGLLASPGDAFHFEGILRCVATPSKT